MASRRTALWHVNHLRHVVLTCVLRNFKLCGPHRSSAFPPKQCLPNIFFFHGPLFGFEEITKDPHILAHVSIECPDDRYSKFKKKLYLRTEFRQLLIHGSSIRNNALHVLTLIALTVGRFVGAGCFLVRCTDGHTKETSQVK